MTIQGFATDSVQQLSEHVENVQLVLPAETKHDDAGILLRWIGSYISEVQIQGYENPAFGSTVLGQHGIIPSPLEQTSPWKRFTFLYLLRTKS